MTHSPGSSTPFDDVAGSTGNSRSLVAVLLAWRRFIVLATAGAAVLAVVVSLLLPSWYSATATILPPDEASTSGGLFDLVSQIGGSGGGLGATRSAAQRLLGRSPVVELAIGVLKSRRTRGAIVDRFGLVDAYDVKTREHAIKALGALVRVQTTPEGLVSVTVDDRDGERAAEMANAFLEVLDRFNRDVSVEDARRTIEFIRSCLDENHERMASAATRLRSFQEEKGAIEIGEQARVTVEAIATLQAERTSLEVRKRVLEQYTMPGQADVQRLEAEIREIDRTIRELEGKVEAPDDGAERALPDGIFTLRELPALGLEFATLKREVLVQEKVYELLTAQYEQSRIRETRDQQTITVLDEAVPPIRRSKPRRTIMVLVSTALAFVLAVTTALVSQDLIDRVGRSDRGDRELRAFLGPLAARLAGLRGKREPDDREE